MRGYIKCPGFVNMLKECAINIVIVVGILCILLSSSPRFVIEFFNEFKSKSTKTFKPSIRINWLRNTENVIAIPTWIKEAKQWEKTEIESWLNYERNKKEKSMAEKLIKASVIVE